MCQMEYLNDNSEGSEFRRHVWLDVEANSHAMVGKTAANFRHRLPRLCSINC